MIKLFVPLLALLMLLKPIWPIVDYVVNYDYIVDYLCVNRDKPITVCNGKCYLAKQVSDEKEKEAKNPYSGKDHSVEFSIINYWEEQLIVSPVFHCEIYEYPYSSHGYSIDFVSRILHPPQFT